MKKSLLIIMGLLMMYSLQAQDMLFIKRSDNVSVGINLNKLDNISFSTDGSKMNIIMDNASYELSTLDYTDFWYSDIVNHVTVTYDGVSAQLKIPIEFSDVTGDVNGSDVTLYTSNEKALEYDLNGQTSNGSFKIYLDNKLFFKSFIGPDASSYSDINIHNDKSIVNFCF